MYRHTWGGGGVYFVHHVTSTQSQLKKLNISNVLQVTEVLTVRQVLGSLVPPSRNTCCNVLRATERWTALHHFTCEDVDDYWSLTSHRRRQERGPRSRKVGCGRLGDYRGSRATAASRTASSVMLGLKGDPGVLPRLDTCLHSRGHFDRTDVISHS
jgi:hypothetical protein